MWHSHTFIRAKNYISLRGVSRRPRPFIVMLELSKCIYLPKRRNSTTPLRCNGGNLWFSRATPMVARLSLAESKLPSFYIVVLLSIIEADWNFMRCKYRDSHKAHLHWSMLMSIAMKLALLIYQSKPALLPDTWYEIEAYYTSVKLVVLEIMMSAGDTKGLSMPPETFLSIASRRHLIKYRRGVAIVRNENIIVFQAKYLFLFIPSSENQECLINELEKCT